MITINALSTDSFNDIVSTLGSNVFKLALPSACDGCVDVELSDKTTIEVVNNKPTITIKYNKKSCEIERYTFSHITIE